MSAYGEIVIHQRDDGGYELARADNDALIARELWDAAAAGEEGAMKVAGDLALICGEAVYHRTWHDPNGQEHHVVRVL